MCRRRKICHAGTSYGICIYWRRLTFNYPHRVHAWSQQKEMTWQNLHKNLSYGWSTSILVLKGEESYDYHGLYYRMMNNIKSSWHIFSLAQFSSFAKLPSIYTDSRRIRIFNCIEEVPRFFFSIEFNSAFQISNYLQLNSTPYTI
jgi:hypothetical protein